MDQCPEGYSELAAFQSSDRNFLLYRGFGYLHARVLSGLQHDVESLERQLDRLDQWDKDSGTSEDGLREKLSCKRRDDLQNSPDKVPGDFQHCFKKTRPQILAELKQKLMEYGKVLLRFQEHR